MVWTNNNEQNHNLRISKGTLLSEGNSNKWNGISSLLFSVPPPKLIGQRNLIPQEKNSLYKKEEINSKNGSLYKKEELWNLRSSWRSNFHIVLSRNLFVHKLKQENTGAFKIHVYELWSGWSYLMDFDAFPYWRWHQKMYPVRLAKVSVSLECVEDGFKCGSSFLVY